MPSTSVPSCLSAAVIAIILATIALTPTSALNVNSAEVRRAFYEQFELDFNNKSSQLDSQLARVLDPAVRLDDLPFALDPATCLRCRVIVHAILQYFQQNTREQFDEQLERLLQTLCSQLMPRTSVECDGLAGIYRDTIAYILHHKADCCHADYSEGVCAILFQETNCGGAGFTIPMNLSTATALDADLPLSNRSKEFRRHSSANNLTILHLTDFHYDAHYAPGSASRCAESVCCRHTSTALAGPRAGADSGAGQFGDYGSCDTPGYVIEYACEHAASEHGRRSNDGGGSVGSGDGGIAAIYYTGDFTDHFEWLQTKDAVREAVAFGTAAMRRLFRDVPVVPMLGNHDAYPSNSYPPPTGVSDPQLQPNWLYEFAAAQWRNWLPESALRTLRLFGYYSLRLRPDLRVIVVNSNVCYVRNVWLLFEQESLRAQLRWLRQELAAAEEAGEWVHLLGHVPAGDETCVWAWNDEYARIVKRYARVISGQFHGHTHYDEFAVQFAGSPASAALNVAWTGGSVTSFVGLNGNYRVYRVDEENFNVLDHETWIFDLAEANALDRNAPKQPRQPRWFREYLFRKAYNVSSLSPACLGRAVNQQWVDEGTLTKMWKNKVKHSQPKLAVGCDEACMYGVLCGIVQCPA